MGLDNPLHIAFLLILLLLVFGAKRLPEMGRSLGSGLRGFKETVSGEHAHPSLTTATTDPTLAASAPVAVPAPAAVPAPVAVPAHAPAAISEPGVPAA